MNMLVALVVGYVLGALSVLVASYLVVLKEQRKMVALANEVKTKQDTIKKNYEAARPRLKKAAQISERQLELYSASQQPSKNALHSKYKNDIIQEISTLEKEKREILRSIIREGLDPEVTLTDDGNGKKEIIKLSEYMAKNGIALEDPAVAVPTPPAGAEGAKLAKNGKFFIIDGGKSDVTH